MSNRIDWSLAAVWTGLFLFNGFLWLVILYVVRAVLTLVWNTGG